MALYPYAALERAMKIQAVILKAMSKQISWLAAAEIIGISPRSMRRWKQRYDDYGYDGLFDRRRGRPSPKRVPVETVERVLQLYREKYFDFNVRHFHEKLVEEEGIQISYTWVKMALQTAGLVERRRRRGKHRRRRERRPLPGMLLHVDGSKHAWLGGDRYYDLITLSDDATNEVYYARLVEEESTLTVMAGLREVVSKHGVFCALYSDRASHFVYTPQAGGRADRSRPTQIERALKELRIDLIPANSPQARGRCERAYRTWQGRLPQELRLRGIRTLEEANRFLANYRGSFNRRFKKPAAQAGTAFLKTSADLDRVFSIKCHRMVNPDNTVAVGRLQLQIEPQQFRNTLARAKVLVGRHVDQTITLWYGPHLLGRYSPSGELLAAPERRRSKHAA
jgi:transposase